MHTYLCRDNTDQLILPQEEIGIAVAGQNVAKEQHHPYLCKSGHVGAHDSYSSLCSGTGEILPQYA